MGSLSFQASNAIIYVTYGILLISGTAIGWYCRDKKTFLSSNGTQKGIPLAFNFVASGMYDSLEGNRFLIMGSYFWLLEKNMVVFTNFR